MPDVARLGLLVELQVLLVVARDVAVRDLDAARDLLVDPFREELRPDDDVAHVLEGQPLGLRLRLEVLRPAELLLELGVAVGHLLVGDRDAELLRLLLQLLELDEERERRLLDLLELRRPRLRPRTVLLRVAALRAGHREVEGGPRDRVAVHDGHRVGGHLRGAAASAAACGREREENEEWNGDAEGSHKTSAAQRDDHAAWRAPSIASTSRSASPNSSLRRVISRVALV